MTRGGMWAVAALAVALAGGCGDDVPERAGTASARVVATPASPFVAQAEAICKEANEKEAALGAPGIDWIHSAHFTDREFLVDFHAVGKAALADLRRLSPPEEDRRRYAVALRAIARMLRGLEQQADAVRAGRPGGTRAVAVYEKGYYELAAVGGALGFTECLGIVL